MSQKAIVGKSNFTTATPLAMLLIFLCSVSVLEGKSLTKYKEDLGHIKSDFALLKTQTDPPSEEIKSIEKTIYEKVPKLLPPRDTVEFDGLPIEINNKWLARKVSEYRSKSKDIAKRKLIAVEIYERLGAIEAKIAELEESVAANITKDENKRKLSEILKRGEYRKPEEKSEDSLVGLWQRFLEWFRKLFPKVDVPKTTPTNRLGSVFYFLQILIYVLVFAVVAFVVYKFAPFFLRKLRAAKKESTESAERIILGERLSVDETPDNLFSEAETLAREGNLRGAIRKGYIALLFELSERNAIGLAKHKTNRDYLRDVRKTRELHKSMRGLTSNYERHWYGLESAEVSDWENFREGYKAAISAKS